MANLFQLLLAQIHPQTRKTCRRAGTGGGI